MKPVFTILLIAMLTVNAFTQIQLKGFMNTTLMQNDVSMTQDTFFIQSNKLSVLAKPLIAVSINQGDNNFHEIGLSNINYQKSSENIKSSTTQMQDNESRGYQFRLNYSYNYCWLKYTNRWKPYVGLQTSINFIRIVKQNYIVDYEQFTFSANGQVGVVTGIQYALKPYLRLEFALPIDIYGYSYQRQRLVSNIFPTGSQINQYASANFVLDKLPSIPFKIGMAISL